MVCAFWSLCFQYLEERSRNDTMKVDVLTEIDIAAPVDVVSDYAGDPDHAPNWYVNIQSVDWRTPKSVAIGSQIAFVATFLGRKLSYVYEIVELVPGAKLVMRTVDGPFPMETTYSWHAIADDSTHMTLRNRGYPTGFSRLYAPFMAKAMRKANEKDLLKLKEILEGRH